MNTEKENLGLIILISCVATIGGFLFGFDSGVINGTVDGLQAAFNADSLGTGMNVASMLIGCAIGAFAAGALADRFGRKTILILTSVLFIVSAWGSGIALSSESFIIFRILGGLAVGAASVLAPAYISEIAPARLRGTLASVQQVAIILGLFSAFISNYYLAKIAGASTTLLWLDYEAWRWMFWIELIPATLFFITLWFIPESPRYLALKGQSTKAQKVLHTLYGPHEGTNIWQAINQQLSTASPSSKKLIFNKNTGFSPIIWVGIGLATLQQLVGINVVFYYGAVLWQAVGYSESDALMINIITGAVSIAACLLTISSIDKIGRKPLLILGSIGMSASLIALVVAFSNGTINSTGQLALGQWGVFALVAANAYVFFFNLSWGPVMWVMLSEMFPNKLRGSGMAIAGFAQWIANFMITLSFPFLLTQLGLSITYGIYATFALLSVVFVLFFIKETKGKTLEQMTLNIA
ncbi:sugar porter family MFS transporter [Algibacillus agarilyticus]|uniref:sugar porter family MFS transporter n=1 Tax=Algibacillus agarilyticus TaxID=2234133 RepID=UPI000DD0CC9C|nr:sugar porter family MFS transporter [Algibacillus agarilyticus]